MLIVKFDFPKELEFVEIESTSETWRTWQSQAFPTLRVQSKDGDPFGRIGNVFVQRTTGKNFGEHYKLNVNYRLRSPQDTATHQISVIEDAGKCMDFTLPSQSNHVGIFTSPGGNWIAVVIHELN